MMEERFFLLFFGKNFIFFIDFIKINKILDFLYLKIMRENIVEIIFYIDFIRMEILCVLKINGNNLV